MSKESAKSKKTKAKRRAEITEDDIKNIIKKNCILTNQVLEMKEQFLQVCESRSNLVQDLCDKKIERINLEAELAAEDQSYDRLKAQVENLNQSIQQSSDLIEFDEQNNHESTIPSVKDDILAARNKTINEFNSFFSTLRTLIGFDEKEISSQGNHDITSQTMVVNAIQQEDQLNSTPAASIEPGQNECESQKTHETTKLDEPSGSDVPPNTVVEAIQQEEQLNSTPAASIESGQNECESQKTHKTTKLDEMDDDSFAWSPFI